MSKVFASQSDLTEKKTSLTEIGDGRYAFAAEGDPNRASLSATIAR